MTDELVQGVGEWFAAVREVIEHHGGSVNKYLGDAVFAYWRSSEVRDETMMCVLRDLITLQKESLKHRQVMRRPQLSKRR